MTTETKKQIGIRIPQELNRRLEKHVNKIGISKPAFILGLIFRELEEKENSLAQVKENSND
jgi:predicted DNA-binding protein